MHGVMVAMDKKNHIIWQSALLTLWCHLSLPVGSVHAETQNYKK